MLFDVKKLTTLGILISITLIIFIIELQLPPLSPVPGVKPGLANLVVLFLLYLGGRWRLRDVFLLQIIRIILGVMFVSNPSSIFYSFSGGMTALILMAVIKMTFLGLPIPIVSVTGAVMHNIAQISAAALIMNSTTVFYYLPLLTISGIISGLFTGFAVSAVYRVHPKFIEMIR